MHFKIRCKHRHKNYKRFSNFGLKGTVSVQIHIFFLFINKHKTKFSGEPLSTKYIWLSSIDYFW